MLLVTVFCINDVRSFLNRRKKTADLVRRSLSVIVKTDNPLALRCADAGHQRRVLPEVSRKAEFLARQIPSRFPSGAFSGTA